MQSICPHETAAQIIARAIPLMGHIVATYPFTDPALKTAISAFVNGARNSRASSIGHAVGMEVHDTYGAYKTLEPGMLLTIEPQLRLPEEHLGVRLEDMILITETGYENLSRDLPIEPSEIEKIMAAPLPKDLQ
jgi:Xaa-Pro aminopeptidase